jgi:complement component 1 Q subcomponent-binding protein, mitochondrial
MLCQEGTFIIENISSFSDGELATALTPEAEYKRRGLYMGPSVGTNNSWYVLR